MNEQLSKSSLRASRQLYDAVKTKVIELEKQNTSRIIAFQSDAKGEWHKIGGNSLLLYYFEVCQKILNLHPSIQSDTDFSAATFPEGVICVRGLNVLEKRLTLAQVLKEKRVSKRVVVYELNISLPLETLNELRANLIKSREEALAVVRPKSSLDPEAFSYIRHLDSRIYEEVRKLNAFDRECLGLETCNLTHAMFTTYYEMNDGLTSEPTGWQKIYSYACHVSYNLNTMVERKMCPIAPITHIWDDCIALIRHIKRAHLKISSTGSKSRA